MELFILTLLFLLNGFFALSEIAVVSSKPARLENLKIKGSKGAKIALQLQADSDSFLSAIQVGITLIGIVTGVYGGVNLAENIVPLLAGIEFIAPYARELAMTLAVVLITYLSIVIGELVPKTLALSKPEAIAVAVAPVIKTFSRVLFPFVWLLS